MKKAVFLISALALVCLFARNIPTDNPIGVNLPQLLPYSSIRVFTDLFKQSSQFMARKSRDQGKSWHWERDELLQLSPNGYPAHLKYHKGQLLSATAEIGNIEEGSLPYIAGQYVLLYEGKGKVVVEDDAKEVSSAPNKLLVEIKPQKKITIRIVETDETNPIKNIRLVPKEYENTYDFKDLFYPEFKKKLVGFKTLKFCEMQDESDKNKIKKDWSKRTQKNGQTQAVGSKWGKSQGVALEYLVELANQLKVDAWFCTPWETTEDYLKEMAKFLKENLNGKLYLQYSTGYGFNQKQIQGLEQVIKIFNDVYGSDAKTKIHYVFEAFGQSFPNYRKIAENLLQKVDVVSISGEFGALSWENKNNIGEYKNLTVNQALSLVRRSILDQQHQNIRLISQVKSLGLGVVTGNGGADIRAPRYGWRDRLSSEERNKKSIDQDLKEMAEIEKKLAAVLLEVNRHSMIKELMLDHLRRWFAVGGSTFVAQSLMSTPAPDQDFQGHVVLLENIQSDEHNSPKFAGLKAYIRGEKSKIAYTSADLPKKQQSKCSPECKWGTCIKNKCQCFAGVEGASCDRITGEKPNKCTKDFGINLDGLSNWSPQFAYIDLIRMSREWVTSEATSHQWDTQKPVEYDLYNYPKKLDNNVFVGSMMVRDLNGHYEKGTYVCLYDGDGVLEFNMEDVKDIRRDIGRIEVDVEPSTSFNNGIFLKIVWTNPEDPVRNIRLIRPGFEETYQEQKFHPRYLDRLKSFSTLRFMDWANTNHQQDTTWSSRTTEKNRTYSMNGAPIEDMIDIANRIGANAWFNIPHAADDDYIQKYAELVKKNLRPDLKVYVEYSNEVWHQGFAGGQYAQQQGAKLKLGESHDARYCYLALRTKAISKIFKSVFSDQKSRVNIVIASQAANPDATKRILACQDVHKEIEQLALAPYFSAPLTKGDTKNDKDLLPIDDVIDNGLPEAIKQKVELIRKHKEIVDQYNLKLSAYESGQGIWAPEDNQKLQQELGVAINRDPRIEQLYLDYLHSIRDAGIELINHFTIMGKYGRYGSWGLLEANDVDPYKSPKFRAVMKYIDQTKICSPPQLQTSKCPNNCSNKGECYNEKCYCYFGSSGDNCQETKLIDVFDCGYKCTFDQGECVQDRTDELQRYFKCKCKPGYSGAHCSLPVCDTKCGYNGKCVGPNKCECYEGFSGQTCEKDCGCRGHGKCDSSNSKCICDSGYKWDDNKKECTPECNCQNGGQCIAPGQCSCPKECKWGFCNEGKCQCFEGVTGEKCDSFIQRNNANSVLGLNLGGVNYWSTELVFKDYFKLTNTWRSQYKPGVYSGEKAHTWDTQASQNLRKDGYPAELSGDQALGTLTLRSLHLKYPAGQYVLLYDGNGVLRVGMDAKVVNERKGRIELVVKPSEVRDNGIYVQIIETDKSNPIRNIRLVELKNENKYQINPFNDNFLSLYKQFRGFRFMDWAHSNGQSDEKWSDRKTPDYFTQTGSNGVALEYLVQLANVLGMEGWFNVPYKADDDYVRNYANFLKQNLRSDLKIYIEYSNEVWNGMFEQGKYSEEMAKKAGNMNKHQWYAKRSLEVFRIFKEVFSTERNRLVLVLATQTANPWVTEQIFSYQNANKEADVLALGGYLDCGLGNKALEVSSKSIDELFDICFKSIPSEVEGIQKHIATANKYNIPVTFYEFGTAISEQRTIRTGQETPGATDKYQAINKHPKMQVLLRKYLEELKKIDAFSKYPGFYFSSMGRPSKYGSWGILEDMYQDPKSAPKYQALTEFIQQNRL